MKEERRAQSDHKSNLRKGVSIVESPPYLSELMFRPKSTL